MLKTVVAILTSCIVSIASTKAAGLHHPEVWFSPAGASVDLGKMFSDSSSWKEARSKIDVFELGPGEVDAIVDGRHGAEQSLVQVDAFRKIERWGMATAVGVPALKEWDCAADRTASISEQSIVNVYGAGGSVQYIDMDEPLVSGLGINKPVCHLAIAETAAKVAAYVDAVRTSRRVADGQRLKFIDTEAYPAIDVATLETWLHVLQHYGFKPDGFNLDVDVTNAMSRPGGRTKLAADLKKLQSFTRSQSIPFGIIIWSGADPVPSDKVYYDDAISWARLVHAAIGTPDRILFVSWVKRCGNAEHCKDVNLGCPTTGVGGCGQMSVPVNLPDNDPTTFSHTRLILDVMRIFASP